jgi:hypothetical protein
MTLATAIFFMLGGVLSAWGRVPVERASDMGLSMRTVGLMSVRAVATHAVFIESQKQ